MREGLGEVEGEGSRGKPGGGAEGDDVAVRMERTGVFWQCGGHVLSPAETPNPSSAVRVAFRFLLPSWCDQDRTRFFYLGHQTYLNN
jgi:hypothetical protein